MFLKNVGLGTYFYFTGVFYYVVDTEEGSSTFLNFLLKFNAFYGKLPANFSLFRVEYGVHNPVLLVYRRLSILSELNFFIKDVLGIWGEENLWVSGLIDWKLN